MAATEVHIQEIGPGRSEVSIDGWTVPGVRGVTVHKQVNNRDTVLIEVLASRVTVLPADSTEPA